MESVCFGAGEIMKEVESVRETIRQLEAHVCDSQARIDMLKKSLRQIPLSGRWTPFRIVRDGISVINRAVNLVVGRCYIVGSQRGSSVEQWTDCGWRNLDGICASPLTHVWLPKRKKA